MRRFVQVGLLALGGLGLLHTSLFTDEYLRYVKEGMRPLLVASGVLLLVLGVAEAWAAPPPEEHGESGHGDQGHGGQGHGESGHDVSGHGHVDPAREEHGDMGRAHEEHGRVGLAREGHGHQGHGHDHSRVPRVAWLLFLPVLSLLFYAPPALGSYTASREPAKAVAVQDDAFDPLPATSPLPITLTDFTQRVQQDRSRAIRGRAVVMTGFVTPAPGKQDGWYLTRIIVNCCAADASSVKVLVRGIAAPKADTWVNVTGTWQGSGTLGTSSAAVALDARGVQQVRKPSNAYMDAVPLTS
ncbi:TIGR03943 family protein [Streptomyces sp. NBC_00103]|uniref:TIGR03943 family putative permease subunit n=1 Tax=Streptomyces sp. NBC_00103 TaxID=2975653 RepID=UPI00224FEAC3|nr:TIGR03943 family protein [Streptomyces sp. NBC_00103]MCX5368804.1 TIGR03943 family protein [Streptomyces sp. NBC_00103]